MSAISPTFSPDELFRLSVAQYHELIERGILSNDDRVELLEGVLVRKMAKNDPHIAAARRCRRTIELLLTANYFYEAEQPILLQTGEPEPDGVVIRGSIDDPNLIKPQPRDLALVIEVADTSLSLDRGVKLRSYALAGIVCYWILNLTDRQLEIYTQPDSNSATPTYQSRKIVPADGHFDLVLDGKAIANLAAADLLPAVSER